MKRLGMLIFVLPICLSITAQARCYVPYSMSDEAQARYYDCLDRERREQQQEAREEEEQRREQQERQREQQERQREQQEQQRDSYCRQHPDAYGCQ